MTVSGMVTFDVRGRVYQRGQPIFDTNPSSVYVAQTSPLNPTTFGYDILSRSTRVSSPDSNSPTGQAVTTTAYGVSAFDGIERLRTDVTDPLSHVHTSFADTRGLTIGVQQSNNYGTFPGGTIQTLTTRYAYDPISELLNVTDTKSNVTTAVYDTLGRMVALTNPDTGRTEWRYDPASNIAVKETARLRAKNQLIRYVYNYDRLQQITYPVSVPVVYTYGTPAQSGDANGNIAGRVASVTNESGLRRYTYDHLGEVASEYSSITNQAQPNLGPYTNQITFTYDSFGRMLTLTYPDTEVVTWGYDHGGRVVSANGHKTTPNPQHPYENPNTAYLNFIGYDQFEQKVRMIQGNGVQTIYAYDPLTRRLSNINSSYRNPTMVQQNQPAEPMQAIVYGYDLVGNITSANNNVPFSDQLNSSALPGPVIQTFAYDNLYQLRTATGRYQERSDWHYEYTLAMSYDTIGNITSKNQQNYRYVPDQNSGTGWRVDQPIIGQAYTDTYKYTGPQPHAPSETDELPANQSQTIPRVFNYDASGNQTGYLYQNSDKRTITWDEEDRWRGLHPPLAVPGGHHPGCYQIH